MSASGKCRVPKEPSKAKKPARRNAPVRVNAGSPPKGRGRSAINAWNTNAPETAYRTNLLAKSSASTVPAKWPRRRATSNATVVR